MKNAMPFKDSDPEEREFLERHRREIEALRREASQCPQPRMISAAMMGALPEGEAGRIETHVASCAMCSALRDGFESVARGEQHADPRQLDRVWSRVAAVRQSRRWLDGLYARPVLAAMAATIVLVVGIGIFSTQLRTGTESGSSDQVSPQTEPTPVLPLEKVALKLPLDALTWRGSEESSFDRYLSDLGQALEPYNRDDFAEAAGQLTALAERYPKAVEPAFYLGVSQLFLNRPAEAEASLRRAKSAGGAVLASDIEWLLAVAAERQGRIQEAGLILKGLCGKDGSYRTRSCEMVPRLRR